MVGGLVTIGELLLAVVDASAVEKRGTFCYKIITIIIK